MKAAATVIAIPQVSRLAVAMDSGPKERDTGSGSARADKEWLTERTLKIMERKDLAVGAMLLNDVTLPLPGRVRIEVLSAEERAEQIRDRAAAMRTALGLYRTRGREPEKDALLQVNQGDAEAADTKATEQFGQDYKLINGTFVRVRGAQRSYDALKVEEIAQVLIDWVGPALSDLEGVKKLTLAPHEGAWILIDAATGWSVRDTTLGSYSIREMRLMQQAFEAGRGAETLRKHTVEKPVPGEPSAR